MIFRARAGTINGMESPISQPESPLEIVRRLENVVRLGTVAEVRYETPARCRIKTGDLVTDWLPWTTARAGGDRSWWAPEVGEQVIVLSPGGNTGAGVDCDIFSTWKCSVAIRINCVLSSWT